MPDLLIHMEIGAQEAEARGGFGDERYEVSEFQAIVKRKVGPTHARQHERSAALIPSPPLPLQTVSRALPSPP
jgi:hypothetical protein